MKKNIIVISAAMFLTAFSSANVSAQPGRQFYVNAGWQFNAITGNDFVTAANGWGAYAEGGYYVFPKFAVGAFASYNTNNEYKPRTTYHSEAGDLTTDLSNSVFQIPFGATFRYRFSYRKLEPYAEAKIGANYSRQTMYLQTAGMYDTEWGFYASPEIGLTWHPFNRSNFGFQLAVYYSYATNRSDAFDINGFNNLGFKLGLSF